MPGSDGATREAVGAPWISTPGFVSVRNALCSIAPKPEQQKDPASPGSEPQCTAWLASQAVTAAS